MFIAAEPNSDVLNSVSVMTSADQLQLASDSKDISDLLLWSPLTSVRPPQTAGCTSAKSLSARSKKPVFQSEEDRLLFDNCLAVDIAPLVSGMYKSQAVNQTVADCSSGSTKRPVMNLLTCTTCSKVFSSLSRCQLHCLTHTTARPYQCPWCNYSTSVPGTSLLTSNRN